MARNALMEWRSAVLSAYGPRGSSVRVVAVALAEFASQKTMMAWPSNPQIGVRADVSVSSVQRSLRCLESSGWLEKSAAGGVRGGPITTRWKLTTPVNLTEVGTTDPGQSDQGNPVDNSTDPGQSDTPTPVTVTATPVNLTATPVTVTPKPVRTTTEPEGVTREHHLQGDLVQRGDPNELAAALNPLRAKYGPAILTEGIQQLRDTGHTYRWPRELAAALKPICTTIAAHKAEAITRQRTQPDQKAITGAAATSRVAKARAALRGMSAQ